MGEQGGGVTGSAIYSFGQEMRLAGGAVIVEAPSTAVVDGMPRSVREAGLADAEIPLESMAEELVRRVARRRRR